MLGVWRSWNLFAKLAQRYQDRYSNLSQIHPKWSLLTPIHSGLSFFRNNFQICGKTLADGGLCFWKTMMNVTRLSHQTILILRTIVCECWLFLHRFWAPLEVSFRVWPSWPHEMAACFPSDVANGNPLGLRFLKTHHKHYKAADCPICLIRDPQLLMNGQRPLCFPSCKLPNVKIPPSVIETWQLWHETGASWGL